MKSIAILIAMLFSLQILAQKAPIVKKTYTTNKIVGTTPEIDADLSDPVWENVAWEDNFIQHEPIENVNPTQKSSFKILYDDNNVYVAIKAFDTQPDSIVSLLTRRDEKDGDFVGIQIDSYNDKLTAFTFIVNSAGVKSDAIFTNDGDNEDFSWDPVWYTKTARDKDGWVAEMKIPLSQLRFSQNINQIWGLQVIRYLYRKNEYSIWQHIPRDASGWVHNFGELLGISNLKPKRQIELMPYAVAKTERYEAEEGNPFKTGRGNDLSFGIDGKVGITNDFTLDFTVNPDFGQVEADPSQVNLSGFESYFEEKRPFFIEGKNILSFSLTPGDNGMSGDNLFYSRRIGRSPHISPDGYDYTDVPVNTPIFGAFKLTGKTKNGISVGILESVTRRETASFELNKQRGTTPVEPFTNYFVGRVQKDFSKGNTQLGAIFTSTNRDLSDVELKSLHKAAYSGGIDFSQYWKEKTYYLNVKTIMSHVIGTPEAIANTQESSVRYFQRPDNNYVKYDNTRTSLTGTAGIIQFGKNGNGHWNYTGWLNWRSPELELNDVGFLRSTDDIFQVFWVGYRIWEPFSIFKRININMNQWTGWDFGGNSTYKGGNINFNTQFKNYWSFAMGINYNGDQIGNSLLRGGPSMKVPGGLNEWFYVESDNRKKFTISFNASNNSGFQNTSSSQYYSLSFNLKPTNAINISVSPQYSISKDQLQYVDNYSVANNNRYMLATIDQRTLSMSFRLNYSITPNLTIQYYGQPFIATGKYNDFKRVTNPKDATYQNRFALYGNDMTYNAINNEYNIYETHGTKPDYTFGNPDFKAMAFLSNLVVRWEYLPGSTVFFVWSQNRNTSDENGNFDFKNNVHQLADVYPHDVFLIKLSYRLKL